MGLGEEELENGSCGLQGNRIKLKKHKNNLMEQKTNREGLRSVAETRIDVLVALSVTAVLGLAARIDDVVNHRKEITDAGTRGTQDTIKGVKRKKIVTENHLKKIPKSPLRSPAETKVKQNVDPSLLKSLPDASERATAQEHLPVQNGNQCTKQNGGALSSEISAETTKSETSMQTKLSLTHQSLDLGKQAVEDTDANQLNSPEKKSLSNSSSSKTKTDSNECINFADCSTSSPCTRTAFDVLLKAMEPELNTLAQECPPYGMQIEKLRPNKTVSTSSSLTSNTMSVQNQSALSQREFAAGPHYYPCALNNVHVATTTKTGQAQGQSVSHSQDLVTKTSQPNHQVVMCPSFTRPLVQQQSQESPKVQQIYSIAVTSSVVHTSSSTVTQVFPQTQLVASSSSPLSISTSSSTHLSIGPMYNSAQIASVVNHGVEQICNLLKDQKPKKLGKYVCEYCNRACAKPSVLQKHIRSHTGERPYPCVTCGFSFKTKSNLYKHKKSHAHAIKLGLVLQPDSSGLFLSHDSDKALSIHSDAEESGESEDEGTADERQDDQELEPAQIVKVISSAETLRKGSPVPLSNPDCIPGDSSLHDTEPQVRAALPKVVVHPVNVSPLRADSPKVTEPAPELAAAQRKGDFKVTTLQSNLTHTASYKENDIKQHQKVEMGLLEEQLGSAVGAAHAQLQRQQATDGSQDQQGKCLLSPRSLGSTDSGYFSRSESADQTMSPPAPFVRGLLTSEKDPIKNLPCVPRASGVVASVVQTVCPEKNVILSGQMRPPMATKTLEERISKLISDNEAVVDDKQLDSVKPRRTSLSRRGSIDSPKSYIFKDSFQFDLKPMGRRTSSSSDIPKSPFTPTEKSKQVFLLSVPSLDCLPITRSNSMPTTSYSAVPPNVIPSSHPLRGSQSFDDKIGSLYDDVFLSGPATPLNQGGHPRTLVRQAAIEDSSTGENQVLGPARSVEESYLGCNVSNESLLQRSKSLAQASNLEKTKKSPQVRGTMFECETCRNRYRKLENFENHKKFYCSELHGPKTKAAIREPEHKTVPNSTQPQILHYRVTTSTGVWEQTPQIRKRRKMKSVGDDDDPQQNDTSAPSKNAEGQSKPVDSSSLSKHSATTVVGSQQPSQILHYRVTTSTGVWEQTPQIRKRRKMKSVGDDDDPQQNDTSAPSKNAEGQSKPVNSSSLSKHSATTVVGSQQPSNLLLQSSQIQLVARGTDQTPEPKMAPLIEKQASSAVQEKVELKRQGTGISVIQHTNSLSRNSSFEKSESFERVSPVSSQESNKVAKHRTVNTVVIQEDRHSHVNTPQHHQPLSSEALRGEVHGSQIVSNERSAPLQPSRLVRQHNIQVPEILVTEEPDRDQENQCSDQEKTERFNWPQRSETLSKLPTEKLPPKKKRIRLAEMEHSSAESSVDSTLSRSLSRESSLSHASSFSASLDKDETSKAENPPKAELISKSSEFLMIPAGSHALAVPGPHYREMRRAASEQISCTQPSMEVVDYRKRRRGPFAVPGQVGVDQNASSFELQTKLSDMSNPYSVPPLKQIVPNNCSSQIHPIPPFVVPVRIHSSMPSYGFATVTPLPHILVTQDQKVPVSGLFPQQEATASSKRMLSPANSLDIAMEKQQKRVKDESGAACMTDARPLHSLNVRSNDPTSKQKKPVLHEKSSKAGTSDLLLPDCHSSDTGASETLKESPESEDLKSSVSPVFVVRKPSELSPVNNQSSLLKAVALSLLNSKQKVEKPLYTQARTTHPRSDVLVYSSKWKNSLTKSAARPGNGITDANSETSSGKPCLKKAKSDIPHSVHAQYKSNEDYVYVRGRGRGKYICEECGIRCKKPSMLKKHIRTHTDVRPYHCNYCNFSFKTKGNLTKHMKSKAHSKKCMDLGVSVGLIDDQDGEEEFGEKQRFGYDRSGYDVEESDGADEDENDNEDDDEDSQAESVLSTTPSVTASPQHHPSRHGLQDTPSADEDIRLPDCFAGVHTDSMDGLPKALLTKMTVLSAVQSVSRTSRSPAEFTHQEAHEDKAQERGAGPQCASAALADVAPTSPGRQMSVDYPDPEAALGHSLLSTAALTKVGVSDSRRESGILNLPLKDLFGDFFKDQNVCPSLHS
ncbi:zinc finger protein hypothetical protein [Limosa lapponica baueri]|uniref:Zinc finger protein 40 n=1 Tax=Limosa lapponica baueri TaxID=1758121 RepID=A0A2I0U7J7_LIMLA|nr:zinc finger protein hypothetical protein [Limosa lapponica baueri]